YVNLSQARERVRVVNVGVAQAREAFRLARLRAIAGVSASPQVSPQLELSNAQATLTQAESNRVNALYDFNVARSALDRATGRFSYGAIGAGGIGGYESVPAPSVTGQSAANTLVPR
ncbi:TolC family protein, partial [bacterium]